jgi:molybdate transport system regulatory protein
MKISARNVFPGLVTAIKPGTVNTEVTLQVAEDVAITAIITKESAKYLGLKKKVAALAIVKSSSVMLATEGGKISARNVFTGIVTAIKPGTVNTTVTVLIDDTIEVVSNVTKGAVKELKLKKGSTAQVIFKASSVLIATEE